METKFSLFTIDSLLAKNKKPKLDDNDVVITEAKVKPDSTDSNEDPSKVEAHPKEITKGGVTVKLLENDLWEDFHKVGTEMIITKAGRRMFPSLKVKISGLEPEMLYNVSLEIRAVDNHRYRYVYQSSEWIVSGDHEGTLGQCQSSQVHPHPHNPAPGHSWNNQNVITFDKLKLTNNKHRADSNQITLQSMHRYQPIIHIVSSKKERQYSMDFTFPQTVFTTVTAYQNQQITKLKIAYNPFAKGFRESTRSHQQTSILSSVPGPTHPLQYLMSLNPHYQSPIHFPALKMKALQKFPAYI